MLRLYRCNINMKNDCFLQFLPLYSLTERADLGAFQTITWVLHPGLLYCWQLRASTSVDMATFSPFLRRILQAEYWNRLPFASIRLLRFNSGELLSMGPKLLNRPFWLHPLRSQMITLGLPISPASSQHECPQPGSGQSGNKLAEHRSSVSAAFPSLSSKDYRLLAFWADAALVFMVRGIFWSSLLLTLRQSPLQADPSRNASRLFLQLTQLAISMLLYHNVHVL